MAAIKATKKVTATEIEKGIPLAPLANDLKLVTQSALENNLQKSKMRNGASLSTRPAQFIDPIKRDESR